MALRIGAATNIVLGSGQPRSKGDSQAIRCGDQVGDWHAPCHTYELHTRPSDADAAVFDP